ncbi:prepilin-type N-terminal cleavage/methylation domain-containing protein [Roseimicrobium gellanilyticum]|uniref:Prepilin-type N-terminal cleavage/methylation domain-containing protein n=1 Tax=Roseimicrobium gellanilyticum TaxID=748857 RepID=A0A366HPI8_9BACT|nr:type II secretion system protein [Roseimicrobium gellanilyticum]RBP45407.1 prepilin-type N-terminal cleavage/methylation domain-containing protein [Roseimicrobium gellanilyticum]
MKTRLQQGFTLIELLVVITIIAILASLAVPTFGRIQEKGNITKAISNCRQIITAMRIYSSDHGGNYMDNAKTEDDTNPQDANSAFRILFTENILDNELIFGSPVSKYVPDGNIGGKDDTQRTKAVESGECHWMMTKGLSDSASGSVPLVYENATSGEWDPTWDIDKKGTNARGRSWSSGVVIGMNDSSVGIQPLEEKKGTSKLKDMGEGNNLFSQHGEDFEVLDIAEGG